MTTKFHQISLKDTFSDCQDIFFDDTPSFFQLLEEHFDISEFIPSVFFNAFYQSSIPAREESMAWQMGSVKSTIRRNISSI